MSDFNKLYKADIVRYAGHPSLYLRVFHFLYRKAVVSENPFVKMAYKVAFKLWANPRGLEIPIVDQMGAGVYFGHAYNITINPNARIGCNCNIHKGVLIGQVNRGVKKGTPSIGNNVWIGINAAIVGNIIIGDDVMIAPNSFVNVDVPSHSVVFGNPCIIKHRDEATYCYINNVATID